MSLETNIVQGQSVLKQEQKVASIYQQHFQLPSN